MAGRRVLTERVNRFWRVGYDGYILGVAAIHPRPVGLDGSARRDGAGQDGSAGKFFVSKIQNNPIKSK
jgi:hypothetical protein